MSGDVTELSSLEKDAFAEIANMGVSRAATSLRQMLGEQVLLSVPSVNIVTRETAAGLVERGGSSKLVAVQQSFEGPFSGKALLIFPESQSLELVRSIVGDLHKRALVGIPIALASCEFAGCVLASPSIYSLTLSQAPASDRR